MDKNGFLELLNQLLTSPLLLGGLCIFLFLFLLLQRISFYKRLKKERSDAIVRSRAVLNGQMVEQLAPFLPDFPCNAGDVRFIGKPVDFIAFSGMAEGKSIQEVLLIEVKTGSSALSGREKEIKKAVEEGRVRYVEYKLEDK